MPFGQKRKIGSIRDDKNLTAVAVSLLELKLDIPNSASLKSAHSGSHSPLRLSAETLEASGGLLPISQNQALFALLGTNYGGDGITTFALPDMRGREIIHLEMKSDDQLARMGLSRDDILPHVFRDLLTA